MPSYPLAIVTIIIATAAIWLGSSWLETASERLSTHYGLPLVVQGAIVAAVGSSFPELASVVFAGLAGAFDLGVGAIVGSAIFNILVIPAVSSLSLGRPLESSRSLVYKEAQFYMLAVSVLLITFSLAVIYYPAGAGDLVGTVTRPLALIPLGLYGLYVFIQHQDTVDHEPSQGPEGIDARSQWIRLLAGLLVIVIAVEQLVGTVEAIGTDLGASSFLLGIVVIAAATSLPDTLVSVRAAQDDRAVASLANVLGSNTFDLLVAIPIGVLLVGEAPVDFAMAVPMFAALTGGTVVLFTLLRTEMTLSRREAVVLLGAYIGFVTWILAEVFGTIGGILPN